MRHCAIAWHGKGVCTSLCRNPVGVRPGTCRLGAGRTRAIGAGAPCNDNEIQSRLAQLAKQASDALRKRGFDDSAIEIVEYLNIKYQGTDTTLMISKYDAQRVVHTYDCIAWSVTID
jgi:hypothetical protein